jgi:hypothetical protein
MNARDLATLTHVMVSTRDRRASLTALGATLAGVLAAPLATGAKQSAAEKCKRRCRQQELRCQEAVAARCLNQDCVDAFSPCCTFLRTCNAAGLINCLFDEL